MPRRDIRDRLRAGDVLLMDGATGSEINRRGVDLSKGATSEELGAWSATANIDAPDVVRAVHEDYLRLGADVIISNNFWTNPFKLSFVGLADRWQELAQAAAEIAIAARDAVNPEAYVFGGIAPGIRSEGEARIAAAVGNNRSTLEVRPQAELYRELADHARLLADAGVDVILIEHLGAIVDIVTALDAVADVDLPIVIAPRQVTPEGTLKFGESFADMIAAIGERRVDAILLMCSRPEAISASLPLLRAAYDGPIGGYANIGYKRNPKYGQPGELWHIIDQDTYPPDRYAEFGREWKQLGAQIIGGCCAVGPEHIAAIAPIVKGEAVPSR